MRGKESMNQERFKELKESAKSYVKHAQENADQPSPGPWTSPFKETVLDANGAIIAEVYRLADAPLMAAAPELLEAVKDALAFLDRPDITTYEWYKLAPEHVGMFRRALAKAGAL
jgi:hypothetical protein